MLLGVHPYHAIRGGVHPYRDIRGTPISCYLGGGGVHPYRAIGGVYTHIVLLGGRTPILCYWGGVHPYRAIRGTPITYIGNDVVSCLQPNLQYMDLSFNKFTDLDGLKVTAWSMP